MRPIVRAAYPADRTAVARARRFVRDTLAAWGADDATDDAVLLTSELATNAVIHARTPFEVICRSAGGTVQIEVVDGDGSQVLPAPPNGDDPNRLSGRGLLMPVMLAAEWGVSYAAASKTVWFRLCSNSGPPPGMPNIPGVEYGLVRGPACGDLYDVFEAAPGHWRFAIGGVRGTGPEAATAIALTRHGLRLLAAEGHGVAEVLTRLDRALVREDLHGRPMRLLHGELVHRPDAGVRLTLVSAGHPSPLRLAPDGTPTPVTGGTPTPVTGGTPTPVTGGTPTPVTGGQPPLGGVRDLGFSEEIIDLDPGDALLCTGEPLKCPGGDATLAKLLNAGLGADGSAALLLRVL